MADRVPGDAALSLKATHGGCEPCPAALGKGAPPGSACSLHRVCQEVCCRCPESKRVFQVAACVEGRCAEEGVACERALGKFGEELCGR